MSKNIWLLVCLATLLLGALGCHSTRDLRTNPPTNRNPAEAQNIISEECRKLAGDEDLRARKDCEFPHRQMIYDEKELIGCQRSLNFFECLSTLKYESYGPGI